MPRKSGSHTRDESITLTCSWCGKQFHPWRRKDSQKTKYCSHLCRGQAQIASINTHGMTPAEPMPIRVPGLIIVDSGDSVPQQPASENSHDMSKAEDMDVQWKESGEHWQTVSEWYAKRQAAAKNRTARHDTTAYTPFSDEGKSITLSGYGARLNVRNGALIIRHGSTYSTQECSQEILYRGTHGVSSLIWITNGGSGQLSIDSLKWCASQNITVRLLTNRGEHLGTLYPSPDAPGGLGVPQQENGRSDITLRRSQYALAPSGNDVPLARKIILRKLESQKDCLDHHPELPDRQRAYQAIETAASWLSLPASTPTTNTLDRIRLYEARASKGYYAGWQGLLLRTDEKAVKQWPPSWHTVTQRKSALTRWLSPKQAVNPAHAALNFAYALLESQIRQSLNAIGADLCCGVLHTDRYGRDSLVFDCMEPLRGVVDDLFLTFLRDHVFGVGDFIMQTTGAVTVHPALCRVLAQAVRVGQRASDEQARWLRSQLVTSSGRVDRRRPLFRENQEIDEEDE